MHVLIIRTASAIGGAEIYNLNLVKGFRDYFPSVRFSCVTNYCEFAKRLEKESVSVKAIPFFNEEIGTKKGLLRLAIAYIPYLFKYLSAIWQINKISRIDLVVLQSTTEKLALTFVLSLLGFKIIWLEHGPFINTKKPSLLVSVYRFFGRFCRKIICVSESVKNNLSRDRIGSGKLSTILTGVKYPHTIKFSSIKKTLINISYIGSVTRGKGIVPFFRISKKILQNASKYIIKFFVVGTGDMLNTIRQNILKQNLADKFILTGNVQSTAYYIRTTNIMLHFSYSEGLSLVLLEAMSLGVPIIARDIGGNRELIVHNVTGYLFKDESEEEIANMVIDLIRNPKKRMAMGRAARARVRKYFSAERWIRQMNDLFEEVSGE